MLTEKLKAIAAELEGKDKLPNWAKALEGHVDRAIERKEAMLTRAQDRETVIRRGPCANLDEDKISCNDPTNDNDRCTDPETCENYLPAKCRTCGG